MTIIWGVNTEKKQKDKKYSFNNLLRTSGGRF